MTQQYGISNVATSCLTNDGTLVTANKGAIVFYNLGRPYSGVSNATSAAQYLLAADCTITLTHPDGNAVIRIRPETGYVSVTYP